jgi:hypothetical protein
MSRVALINTSSQYTGKKNQQTFEGEKQEAQIYQTERWNPSAWG